MSDYAYTLKTERIKEMDFPYSGQAITCTSELLDFARKLWRSDIEKMIVVYIDAQNKVICLQIMNGTVNQAVVYPREVLKHALLSGASAMILLHNHPSGVCKPSDADIRLTTIIKDASKLFDVMVHDHVIMGDNAFFSFREEGIM